MTQFRIAFAWLAVVWAAAVPAAALAASRTPSGHAPIGYAFALLVYEVGGVICHQRPERSFHLFGAQLPVCARCAGIYLGAAVAAMLASIPSRTSPFTPPFSIHAAHFRLLLLLSALPAAATLLFEWTTGQMPGHWVRAASGVCLGAAIAWIVCRASAEPGRNVIN